MAKAISTEAAASLPGDARAPQAGAAQPPLDLSLGHFGTTEGDPDEDVGIEVLSYGHLRLVIDFHRLQVTLLQARGSSISREARRRTERRVHKQLLKLRAEGFELVQGGGL